MPFVTANRIREITTSTGNGNLLLSGTTTGYKAFSTAMQAGDTCQYLAADPFYNEWEIGVGSVVGTGILARTSVISSSNANNPVSFSTGTKYVGIIASHESIALLNRGGTQSFSSVISAPSATITNLSVTGSLSASLGSSQVTSALGYMPAKPTGQTFSGPIVATTGSFSGAVVASTTLSLMETGGNQSEVFLDQAGSSSANLSFSRGMLRRWTLSMNNNAEVGSAQGSNLTLSRFDDTGGYLGSPFFIARNTGDMIYGNNVSVTGNLSSSSTVSARTSGATTAEIYVDQSGTGGGNFSMIRGGKYRWIMAVDATTESGSNAGSNFGIARFNDAGNYVDTPFFIARNTGDFVFSSSITATKTLAGNIVTATSGTITNLTVTGAITAPITASQVNTALGFSPPKSNATTTDPTTGSDNTQGYAVNSEWTNTSSGAVFVCTSAATGAAVWMQISPVQPMWVTHFGDGSDGDLTVTTSNLTSGPLTSGALTRDAYFNNLTINSAGAINLAGFRLFVRGTLDITAAAASALQRGTGTPGNAGSGSTGGAAVGGQTAATVGGSTSSGAGGAGGATTGTAASASAAITGNGGAGGGGGAGGLGASGASVAGVASASVTTISFRRWTADLLRGASLLNGGQHGTGGTGGSGDATAGGGGGGGGAGCGVGYLSARVINRGAGTTAGCFSARGGTGGAGAAATAGNRGGGGGGGGGGGWWYIAYGSLIGATATNAINVSGGTGGAGGAGFGTGGAGVGGTGGAAGRVTLVNLGAGTTTETVGGAGSAGSGTTGGAGGSLSVSL